ncbi:hypothetical protein GQ43DRAFT_17631 [Delitschia confertaspora ATCC 74209]|uniref:CRAL-TRIO domain-containing protein n=1 Tax=Delitschia confertaspora ATCC 74209 TaxID=1513339 RepID=A0A9P4MZH1_9PLEO|nr:hypothetical protein GQ43DRAFT_17631 [Delitschia confertaspora ATCC 74209]
MRFLLAQGRGLSRLAYRTPLGHIPRQPQYRFSSAIRCTLPPLRASSTQHCTRPDSHTKSGSGTLTLVVVLGIALGGALLFPRAKEPAIKKTVDEPGSPVVSYSDTTYSYLVMPPNTPPGRPGTLTPEQEMKLRELWAATMKVFGVYESASAEADGITDSAAPSETTESTAAGKKEKKKSRLNVFRRHKDDKDAKSDSVATTGNLTALDMSKLSVADEDDKHGQGKEFKAALANSEPEDLRKAFWSMVKHDHPDALLLRFLRARKWDVEKALVMLISTMHWRAEEMHVDDDIMRKGEAGALEDSQSADATAKKEGEDFLTQMRMGKSFLHGVDKEGRPLCFVRVRLHKQGEQTEKSLERFTVYTIETARMLLRPPIDTATVVFDMTGFSMANMDYTPVKFMIKCFEANYPESLGAVLVHKAPWIFQGIWSIIRGWLDPVVAGKVHFTKNVDELEGFIPRNQIPTELGGDEDWTYAYVEPNLSENSLLNDHTARDSILAKHSELVRKYESTLLDWIHSGEQGDNTKSADERREARNAIAEELRKNYWQSDPYLRARSYYDRTGVLGEAGQLDFYPKKKKETVPTPAAASAVETNADDLD